MTAENHPEKPHPTHLDGHLLVEWADRAARGLADAQSEINTINVFPIPDSDTGSNMAHTMAKAAESTRFVDANDDSAVASALASGAVRNARGNSGLVISQVMRSLSQIAATGPVDAGAVATMLEQSTEYVREAISMPVEGTIISVLDAAAHGARRAVEADSDLVKTVAAVVSSAEEALVRTPEQLPVLAEAGVVDAGGRGFVVMTQALLEVLGGHNDHSLLASLPPARVNRPHTTTQPHAAASTELEVMFFFESSEDDPEANELRAFLDAHGNSVIIGALDDNSMTVHVHSARAGRIIEKAFSLGTVSDLRIEALPAEGEYTGQPDPAIPAPIIALTPPGGAADMFEAAGAVSLASNDKEAVKEALQKVGREPVIVLANGRDTTALMTSGAEIDVINTEALVGGLAALAVYDPGADWDDCVEEMVDAVSVQRWISCGANSAEDRIAGLLDDGGELVTVLYSGPHVTEASAQQMIDRLRERFPDAEFDLHQADDMGQDLQIGVE
ncbi:DAK2 domain-containing protein [uncultured Corynebacterium sp.]|uniref:DAK2 domain-containing protein n=1 Tax=uncultured Corynebacterium sp. TaxID=159447 RepID=UPI0025F3DFB3|nr:DAK2 domain-containing protein [uncultured Corynebacterium sp.]